MEPIQRARIQMRHERMVAAVKEYQEKIRDNPTITEDELFTARATLQHLIEAFDQELKSQHNMEVSEYTEYMRDQLKAEELSMRLKAMIELYERTQTRHYTCSTKLPKLSLTKYSGNALTWHEFWDKFEANIDSKPLKDVEKLSYLMGSLEGSAMEALSGLATTNANYTVAVEILKNKYGSNDRVIDAHHGAINNIGRSAEGFHSCRQTLDTIERHLRVLQALGEDMESNHLRVTIASKFPEAVLYQVNLLAPDDHSVPTLRNNLNRVVTAMELSATSSVGQQPATITPTASTTEALQITSQPVKRFPVHNKKKHNTSVDGPPSKRQRLPCLFCKMINHASTDCRRVTSVNARKEKLKGRCLLCLRRNHTTEKCRRKVSCFRCKGNHLQMLCTKQKDNSKSHAHVTDKDITVCSMSNRHTFLQTAVVTIQNPCNNKRKKGRLLLDSGSQRSYLTSKAALTLELSSMEEDLLLVYTFGADTPQEMSSPSVEINIETKRGINRKVQVNVVPRITDRVPVAKIRQESADILADDDSVGEGIDILIGNDLYCSFLREGKIKISDNLYLIDTDFGWILSGHSEQKETDILSVTTYCQCHTPSCSYFTEPDLPLRNIDVKFLWSLESIGITDSPKATQQEQAVSHFNETVQYRNGRYEVKWPWIQYPPDLPSNLGLALGRLRSLVKRLDNSSLLEYEDILREQLNLGIIEVVDPHEETNHVTHYLPHHMVKQKGKRGRVVYDASAKITGQKSLNECMYSGPSMLEDLTALLLKFRTKRIGIVADVEKAFLQVGLQQTDRDVTRFLWMKDIAKEPTEDNLLCLRFCRVPFGIISSPFLLTATIRHHIAGSKDNLLKTIADKCYVDNLVTGTDTVEEANHLYDQTRSTFEELAMNIRDWVSNSKQFMDVVPKQHKAVETAEIKVLGLTWDVQKDTLKLKISEDNFNTNAPIQTKREVLRTLARVYDPCGFVCPLVLPIKLLFQRICKEKVKWDTILPHSLMQQLGSVLKDLRAVKDINLPRYIGTASPDVNTSYELHCFTDSSKFAYGAVVYVRVQGKHDICVSFVMAKSRVSQIQDQEDLKIPRLELLGFLIGSRLLKYVKTNLDVPVQKEYLWSDSLVVLGWMRSNKLLPPFVANRVNEIKRNHLGTEMYYIQTKLNPADIATRPQSELWDLRKELWYNGPEFLSRDTSCWPANRHYDTHQTFLSFGEALDDSPGESYNWSQLEEANSITMEIDDSNPQEEENVGSSQDKNTCEIKKIQQQHFPDEMAGKSTHLTKNLDLFLDTYGILRCGGRMANTTWSYDMKYPILLPKDSEFTNQLIIRTHESNYHVGASHTLSIIRKLYWIPQGKAKVIKILKTCKQCVKHGGGPYKLPAAPPLPPERVNYCEPFSYTGVDYFGPLFVNSSGGKEKRWVALFTCLTVRAIHLEIVKDLSAEECLLALRRFAATRIIPKRMYSDNATCFKLTSEVMTSPYCIENKIQWKFIPQLAPWHGGFYERLVGLVKHCLKRTLEKHLLGDSKLLTVIKETEAVVNTRPLTRVGTEMEHILRPADFLSLGKCLTAKPSMVDIQCTGTKLKSDLIDSWKRGIMILEEFKRMFIGRYLVSLRERSQHCTKQPRIKSDRVPKIGDIVQIKGDSKNRQGWKVGKIETLAKGADGKCRVAGVKVDETIFTRSIGHLYPLEDTEESAQCDDHTVEKEPDDTNTSMVDMSALDSDMDVRLIEHQSQNAETEVQIGACSPKINSMIEPQTICGTDEHGGTGDGLAVTEENVPVDAIASGTGNISEVQELQPSNDKERCKRDAAIRARQRILEWTRNLLALLD